MIAASAAEEAGEERLSVQRIDEVLRAASAQSVQTGQDEQTVQNDRFEVNAWEPPAGSADADPGGAGAAGGVDAAGVCNGRRSSPSSR